MPEIVALLQTLTPLLESKTLHQLSHAIFALLVISGRVTMLGLARWAEKGGRYRTLQRLYHTWLPWEALQWCFFRHCLWQPADAYLIVGDETVVTKAGRATHGLDRFFSSLQPRVVPGLSFFALALVNSREGQAYPLQVTQTLRSPAEIAARQAKAAPPQTPPPPQRAVGRPKGSQDKNKQARVLTAELTQLRDGLRR